MLIEQLIFFALGSGAFAQDAATTLSALATPSTDATSSTASASAAAPSALTVASSAVSSAGSSAATSVVVASSLQVNSSSAILTGSYPTATLLLQGNASTGFEGAIVHATSCQTTYALTCTDSAICDSLTATVTEGAFDYVVDYFTTSANILVYLSESCSLKNVATAACSAYASVSYNGTTSTSALITTVSGAQLNYAQVPITAGGGELTAPGAAPCSVSGSASGSTVPTTTFKPHKSGLSSGAKAGIGVGVGVGVPLILGAILGTLFYLRRRRRSSGSKTQRPEADEGNMPPPAYHEDRKEVPSSPGVVQPQQQVQEMPSGPERQELPAEGSMNEMPGNSTGQAPEKTDFRAELAGDERQGGPSEK